MSKDFCIIEIKDGKIVNKTPLAKMLWGVKDGRYELKLSRADKRSNQANRFYWGICIPLVQQGIKDLGTEITKEECHEFLKAKFNYQELVNENTGEFLILPRSTAGLNKLQFSEYIEKIQQFSAEYLNVIIPDPNTQLEIQL